ncbi:MAG TPA: hypothetical protein DDX98_08015 [Bacteroidales bacterium]|jgi:outer membrane protein OmpA-like peptidoglycan-associated protein|nr:hypothetical protein [Bacteroidales bacterium]
MIKFCSGCFTILLLLLFSIPSVNGQIWLNNEVIYNEAEGYILGEEHEEALPLYQLLEKKGLTNANINYKIGLCYLKISGKETKAIPYLEAAVEHASQFYQGDFVDATAPLNSILLLGQAYSIANNLEKAEAAFIRYSDSISGTNKSQLADYYIKKVEIARLFKDKPASHELKKIRDNSYYDVFRPVAYSDSIIYYMEARPFYNAVISGAIHQEILIERENLTPFIGSDDNPLLSSISPDGKRLFFTAYITGMGDEIVYSEMEQNGKWSNYKVFSAPVNTPSNEAFASITADGKTMYISSNRPGGFGGNDIYKIKKNEKDEWGAPENLGQNINTPFDETACYISQDGNTLYFSSEGHMNMGGHDLFYSKTDSAGNWHPAVNFGIPISTTGDDDFISVTPSGALFTSKFDTKNSNKKIIYRILVKNEQALKHEILVKNQLTFTEEYPPKEVAYIITNPVEDRIIKRSVTDENGFAQNLLSEGEYLYEFLYNQHVNAKQKLVITSSNSSDELTMDSPSWEKVAMEVPERIIVVQDVLFGFDSYQIATRYFNFLDALAYDLAIEKDLLITIEGHTDAIGSNSYNRKLALKRAIAVSNYLQAKGVETNRIKVFSRGESDPVAINNNADGSDNAEGRKFNRRVSITIQAQREDVIIQKDTIIPPVLRKK